MTWKVCWNLSFPAYSGRKAGEHPWQVPSLSQTYNNLYSNQHIHTYWHFNIWNSPECTCKHCGWCVGCFTFTHWFIEGQPECPIKLLFRHYDCFICMLYSSHAHYLSHTVLYSLTKLSVCICVTLLISTTPKKSTFNTERHHYQPSQLQKITLHLVTLFFFKSNALIRTGFILSN